MEVIYLGSMYHVPLLQQAMSRTWWTTIPCFSAKVYKIADGFEYIFLI